MNLRCWLGRHDWTVRFNDSPRFSQPGDFVEMYWIGGGFDKRVCGRCRLIKPYYRREYDHLPELLAPVGEGVAA